MTEDASNRMMDEYRTNVRELFRTGSPAIVGNASSRHAAILIEEMVQHTEHSFSAFAGHMNPIVWNEKVMAAVLAAFNRGVEIKLVVEKDCEPISNNTMPEEIRRFVKKLAPNALEKLSGNLSHCATGDGKSMRIETDDAQKSAMFSANNPDLAGKVLNVVDGLYQLSVDLCDAA